MSQKLLFASLALAANDILTSGYLFESHRSTRVKLVRKLNLHKWRCIELRKQGGGGQGGSPMSWPPLVADSTLTVTEGTVLLVGLKGVPNKAASGFRLV